MLIMNRENIDKEFKGKINNMFKLLRRKGYIARQNFNCCSSCGWAEIGEVEKAVFYHRQDAENL